MKKRWLESYKPVRQQPRLWVERLWLVESREPFAFTRSVELHPGLNIVWARESASKEASGLASAGHGVGKTSLCLLMRYVLGDDAPAISVLRDKASAGFPKGGVAAKVHVDGATWLVFRPYGAYGHSVAAVSETLESLLQDAGSNEFQEYLRALELFSIGRLAAQSLPGTSQPLRWRHLLAWCIRDQRTRFDGFYHWRDGEGLGFTRPRRDPPLFVSSVLGLVDVGLDQLLRDVESKQSQFDRTKERIPELERTPAYALSHAERQLRVRVHSDEEEPLFETMLSDSVESRLKATLATAVKAEAEWEQEAEQAEDKLAAEQVLLERLAEKLERAEVELGIAKALVEANRADFERLTKARENLERLEGRCDHGDVEFAVCQHILERKSAVSMTWFRDGKEVKANAPERMQQMLQSQADCAQAESAVAEQKARVSTQRAELRRLRVRIATSESSRLALKKSWEELTLLHTQKTQGVESAELVVERERLARLEGELSGLRSAVLSRRSLQSSRADTIKALTACLSTRLLGAPGYARFVQDHELRPFEVSRGGEAYQVLEVLIGDVVCLLDSATSEASSHPGFLVHDCPREADMSEVLYREFFLAAAEAAEQLATDSGVAFQFIVTTTSSPPVELRGAPYVVLELEPGSDENLLFKRELVPELPGLQ